MKSGKFLLAGVVLLILLAGIIGSLWVSRMPAGGTVRIVQDGEVLSVINLSEAKDQLIEVEYEGRKNIIQIQDGEIRMLEAECPDLICVQQGWLHSAAPIVCLPNRLMVESIESENRTDGVVK